MDGTKLQVLLFRNFIKLEDSEKEDILFDHMVSTIDEKIVGEGSHDTHGHFTLESVEDLVQQNYFKIKQKYDSGNPTDVILEAKLFFSVVKGFERVGITNINVDAYPKFELYMEKQIVLKSKVPERSDYC